MSLGSGGSGVSQTVVYMTRDAVSRAFRARGWVRSAGGDLYYNGLRTTTHPHLHVQIGNYGMVRVGRNIQLAVSMMAWSDGRQGQGGGGRTYILDGEVNDPNWQQNAPPVNSAVHTEFMWIMDYFTTG
jgi:hypothetical protein